MLMRYDEEVILELPGVGIALHEHLAGYYQFRLKVQKLEENLLVRIGQKVVVPFAHGWNMYLRYALQRFGGLSADDIPQYGNYLNYGITWQDTERVYTELSCDPEVRTAVTELFGLHTSLVQGVVKIKEGV
jgi:hypothetical protein